MRWGNDFTSGRGVNAMLNTQLGDRNKLIQLGKVGLGQEWSATQYVVWVSKNPNEVIQIFVKRLARFAKCNFRDFWNFQIPHADLLNTPVGSTNFR